jgi:integration host factor subunit alpha
MSLSKADIVDQVTGTIGFTRKRSTETVEVLLEILKRTLASGEDVLVSRFGKFCIQHKASRKGRNPATGGEMPLRSRKRVAFRCSGKLRDRINGES